MKFPSTSEIRKRRKLLDVTQAELALASGVSQSTITKVEQGKISASYDTIVKLFETLDDMADQMKETHIMDIASREVASVQYDEMVSAATDILKEKGFSQIPVLNGEQPVGSISERSIFKLIRAGKTLEQLSKMNVSEIMDDSFPTVSENASVETVSSMLTSSNAVLVTRKGKILGLITSADLLKLV